MTDGSRRFAMALCGKRAKWLVLVGWLIVTAALGPLAGKLDDVKDEGSTAVLPRHAESVQVLHELEKFRTDHDVIAAVTVYSRTSGITQADRDKSARDRAAFRGHLAKGATMPATTASKDGKALMVVVPLKRVDGDATADEIKKMRATARAGAPAGLDVEIGGPAGQQSDYVGAFENLDANLMAITGTVVIVLLLLIYRSPFLWLFPVVSVGLCLAATQGTVYLLARHADLPVDPGSASILMVLAFGVGTDYALLLIARYREELHRHEDRHVAMAVALRKAGPAIIASGATVVAGLLCLAVADINSSRSLGLVGAVGVLWSFVAMLTALPALLVIAGRWVFLPFRPKYGTAPRSQRSVWGKVGAAVARRPRPAWVLSFILIGAAAATVLGVHVGIGQAEVFQDKPESVVAQERIAHHYPAGASGPAVVVARAANADAVLKAVRATGGVASALTPTRSPDGSLISIEAVLKDAPDSSGAASTVDALRKAVHAVPGAQAVVGGQAAERSDTQRAADSDLRAVIPLVLGVILLVLILLLRSLVAPLLLLLTVAVSYLAALGASNLVFERVLGHSGVDWTIPLVAFVFLAALGIDYNIFLMTRVREETRAHGHEQGVVRALAGTGGVISSAGVVLAATFAVFAAMPVTNMIQMGIVVALGILVDTFLVRTVLVPALVLDAGRATWWPGRLFRDLGRRSRSVTVAGHYPADSRTDARL
ncbi:MMPL family transporter [Streptomyces sp. NPDC005485]|uniref:MMPL family transporter n=1 Tax=Streptomyces sp. NPDC005485 TaxID=3155591 RepID=UPI0033AB686C